MRLLYLSIALVFLAGCAAKPTVKAVTLPNGGQGLYLTCDLAASDWTACYELATESCGGKYEIVDKSETSTATEYGPIVRRSMMVECNG